MQVNDQSDAQEIVLLQTYYRSNFLVVSKTRYYRRRAVNEDSAIDLMIAASAFKGW